MIVLFQPVLLLFHFVNVKSIIRAVSFLPCEKFLHTFSEAFTGLERSLVR